MMVGLTGHDSMFAVETLFKRGQSVIVTQSLLNLGKFPWYGG